MFRFSGRSGHHPDDYLTDQLHDLRHQVETLSRLVQQTGSEAGTRAGRAVTVLGSELRQHGQELAQHLGHTARRTSRAVRKDPVPAIVGAAGLLLVLSLVLGTPRGRQTDR